MQTANANYAQVLLDSMYQFVGLLDPKGTLLEVNRPALEGGGLKADDVLGKPFWEASWWQVDDATVQALRGALHEAAAGQFVRYEVQVYASSAGRDMVWIDFSLKPIRNAAGEIEFLCAEGRNIDEKKRAEAALARQANELRTLYDRLKSLDRVKSQFFANVSHELRTPLTLILVPVRDMLHRAAIDSEQLRDLTLIERNATLVLKHVDDILDLARLDDHQHQMHYQPVDVAQMVRELGANFETLARQRHIQYVVNAPRAIMAEIDTAKLSRVLLNLLSNAFKFTPDGGNIMVSALEIDHRFTLVVRDSGPGVPAEQRETVFDRFIQGDGSSRRRTGGTGLGLSIAKEFVSLHRGSIRISDAPGTGAVFEVMLPISAPPGARLVESDPADSSGDLRHATVVELESYFGPSTSAALPPASVDPPPGAPTVLVVEDNPDLRELLVRTLRAHYRVTSARDGEEALEMARAHPPELVLTDMMMPKMSGEELLQHLSEDPKLHQVPVVVLTAKVDDALKLEVLARGQADDFLAKPFTPAELLARVRARIHRGRDTRRAYRDTLALLQAVGERVQDAIFLKDLQGRYTFMNPAGASFLGLPVDDIIGRTDREILGDREAEWIEADDRRVLDEGKALAQEELDVETLSAVRSFYTTKAPFTDFDGQIRGLIGIARDITEKRRLEQEGEQAQQALRHNNELLEQRVEERTTDLSTFTYQVSHDLRSPLRVIEGFAQAVLEDYGDKLDDMGAMYLQRISAGAQRMDRLITDLLKYSQLSRQQMRLAVVSLPEVIDQVLLSLDAEIEQSKAVVVREDQPCAVIAHTSALVLALENLIANAIKFVPDDTVPRVTITTATHGDMCRVSVRDNGIGIAPEHQAGIWSMFERLHSEEQYPGTGVGLALVQRSVERMGGRCGVRSEPGHGSLFWLQLPREHDA